MDIYRIVWVKAWSFFMPCKSFPIFLLEVDKIKKLPNYYKIFIQHSLKRKQMNKQKTLPKPATILSFSYGHKSLQVCAFQAILKQLLSSICIFWNSFQALMKNPCTFLDFALSKNKSTDTTLHAPIQGNWTRDCFLMYFFYLRKCQAHLVTDNANQQKRWEHNKHNPLRGEYICGRKGHENTKLLRRTFTTGTQVIICTF